MEQKTFGEFLAQKRKEKNLTQKELAGMLFVSESTVSKWEKDVAHPDLSMVQKLSEILGVTEHELISASVDEKDRENKAYAKKWKTLSRFRELFFFIAYGTTILACFIVNLAVGHTLSWFFIVFFSLLLSATFTSIPKYIKRYRIVLIPLSELFALILLFAVINIYTDGSWFLIATVPVIFGFFAVMLPVMIANSDLFSKIKKYNALVSVATDFVLLCLTLLYINSYSNGSWFFAIALPLAVFGIAVALIHIAVLRLWKINGLVKASVLVFLWSAVFIATGYGVYPILEGAGVDTHNSTDFNPFKFNFSLWSGDYISYNVCFIIFASLILIALVFGAFGMVKAKRKK